jgi:RNA polymerase sigma factor (sigma-70 family)
MIREQLEALVRMHQAELFRYVRYLGEDDRSAAEDLVQETFLAAFRAGSGTPPTDDLRRTAAWLRGIARNVFLMHCRRSRRDPVRADSETLRRAEDFWEAGFLRGGDGFDTVEALRACLGRLDERRRQLLDLRYVRDVPRAEMARLLEMTEDGIKRAGVIVGTLTAKGPNWIEVKADGEEKARRYVPHWRGGLPKDGGGPDKAMVRIINGLTVGSRLRVGWEFEERARVVKVEVLEKAAPRDGDREEPRPEGREEPKRPAKGEGGAREGGAAAAGGEEGRQGQSVGTIAATGSNWIDLKGDGDAKPRRYYFLIGRVSREMQQAHRELPVGTRVRVEWTFVETWRMLAVQKLGDE